jgi:hypothetical protein
VPRIVVGDQHMCTHGGDYRCRHQPGRDLRTDLTAF